MELNKFPGPKLRRQLPESKGSFLFFLDLLTDHELDRRELMGRREQCGRVVLWCLVPGG